MKNKSKLKSIHEGRLYLIEEDIPEVGWYLYVFKDKTESVCIYDHLQDELDYAKNQALKDYGVPLDSWEKKWREL